MTNKLYDSKGNLIGYIATVEKKHNDDLVRVILSTGHELTFGPCDLISDRDGNWRIASGAIYHNYTGVKEATAMNAATIKNVIFAPPATVVYWSDDTKTIVKCSENDIFDPEKGLAMAIAKRAAGNKGNYYNEIRKWVDKAGKKYPGKPAYQDVLKKYISGTIKDLEEFIKAHDSGNVSMVHLKMTDLRIDRDALKLLESMFNK